MLDRMIHDALDEMAGSDQPPARVSVTHAIRRARAQRRRQGLTAAGAPVLAAGAVLAIGLTGVIASGQTGPEARAGSGTTHAAPRAFNPLVPYVAASWLPHGGRLFSGLAWSGTFLLNYNGASVLVYAADQCVLRTPRLACGAMSAGTDADFTLRGVAPDVGSHTAYWVGRATGDLGFVLRPGTNAVVFQYARDGWAVVSSTSSPADVIRIAAHLRYGQTSGIRLPVRLTALPTAWRHVEHALYFTPGPTPLAPTLVLLDLSRHPTGQYAWPPDSLVLEVGVGNGLPETCSKTYQCAVVDGYQVYLVGWTGSHGLIVPRADGLHLQIAVDGPQLLTPVDVLAHHLQLLGPNPAHWSTHPIG